MNLVIETTAGTYNVMTNEGLYVCNKNTPEEALAAWQAVVDFEETPDMLEEH